MNLMTITTQNPKLKKYNVNIDLASLERIAGSLGLFRPSFLKDLQESVADMKAQKFIKAKNLKAFR